MKQDKQIKAYAKQLLKISIEDGQISSDRVGGVLQALEKNPPRRFLAVLKQYQKLVERKLAKSTAVVYHAGAIDSASINSIKKQLTDAYGRKIDAVSREDGSLIAGIRVVVDSDVYEASVANSLKTLESSLS